MPLYARHVLSFASLTLSATIAVFCTACGGAMPTPKVPSAQKDGDGSASAGDANVAARATLSSATTGSATGARAAVPPAGDVEPGAQAVAAPEARPAEEDPWEAFRHIASEDVLKTTRAAQPKVQACIREGMKRDPSESGEVQIEFVVTQAGQVLAWKDNASSMPDESTTGCIGELIKTLKFPPQKTPGNSRGTYSIHVSN